MSSSSVIHPPRGVPMQLRYGLSEQQYVRQPRRSRNSHRIVSLQVPRYHTIKSFSQQYLAEEPSASGGKHLLMGGTVYHRTQGTPPFQIARSRDPSDLDIMTSGKGKLTPGS